MEAVPTDKPLLTDEEIDLFREISREEFNNFKTSNAYSLFKGKKSSKAEATIDIDEIDEPNEQSIAEVDRESRGTSQRKLSVIGLKDSQSAIDEESSADPSAKSKRMSSRLIASSSVKRVKTPTKTLSSSSAESVSLPPSPAPVIEKVEQQRSTHIALSGQGHCHSSVEDVLSLAGYQESKPRMGSATRVLSSPGHPPIEQRRLLVDGKPRSVSSVSNRSVASRSSTPKAKRSLFDANQSESRTNRHVVTYDEDLEGTKESQRWISIPGSTASVQQPADKTPRTASVYGPPQHESTSRSSVVSVGQHQLSLRAQSNISATFNQQHKYGVSPVKSHFATTSHPKDISHSNVGIDEKLSRTGTESVSHSSICTAPLIIKSSSGNLRAVMPEIYSHPRRQTLTGSNTSQSGTRTISPQISRVMSKNVEHDQENEGIAQSQVWIPITGSITSAPQPVKKISTLSRESVLKSSTHSLGSRHQSEISQEIQIQPVKTPSDYSTSVSRASIISSVSSDKQRVVSGNMSQVIQPELHIIQKSSDIHSNSSQVCIAPLIVKSSSGKLRAITSEIYNQKRKQSLSGSPRRMSSQAIPHQSSHLSISSKAPGGESPVNLHGTPDAQTSPRHASSVESRRVLSDGQIEASAYKMEILRSEQKSSLANTIQLQSTSQTLQEHPIVASSYHTAVGAFSDTNANKETPYSLDVLSDLDLATSYQWQPLQEYDVVETTKLKSSTNTVTSTPSFTSTTDVMPSFSKEHTSDWRPLNVSVGEDKVDDHVNRVNSQVAGQDMPAEPGASMEWQVSLKYDNDETIEVEESDNLEQIPSQKRRASKFGYSGYVGRFTHILDINAIPPSDDVLEEIGKEGSMDESIHESILLPHEIQDHISAAGSQETLDEEADMLFDDAREGITDQEDSLEGNSE